MKRAFFFKAIIPGGAAGNLFDQSVQVKGHTTKQGVFVRPHAATRQKRAVIRQDAPSQNSLLGGTTRVAVTPSVEAALPGLGAALTEMMPRVAPGRVVLIGEMGEKSEWRGRNGVIFEDSPTAARIELDLGAGMPKQRLCGVVWHEIGHMVCSDAIAAVDSDTRDAILAQWRRELSQQPVKTHAVRHAEQTETRMPTFGGAEDPDAPPFFDLDVKGWRSGAFLTTPQAEYFTKFEEWVAESVAEWLATNKRPVGVVQQFMADIAAKLLEAYTIMWHFVLGKEPDEGVLQKLLRETWDRPIAFNHDPRRAWWWRQHPPSKEAPA